MRFLLILLILVSNCAAALTPKQQEQNLDSFEYVWSTIRDKHWDKTLDGAQWRRVHDELRPKVARANSIDEVRAVIRDMIGRLHLTHFAIIPNDVIPSVKEPGSANLDVRVVGNKAIVVSGKYADSEILNVGDTIERVGKLYEKSTLRDMMLARAVQAAVAGKDVELAGPQGAKQTIHPEQERRRGEPVHFGNLPTQYVWMETKTIGDVGYVAFNLFLDIERVIPAIGAEVGACQACRGFILDLRGNVGGIGGMAMGIAGFFVSQQNERLGTMQMRDSELKFFINPRQPHFDGKLAILVDGLSASTSEILAGGLQDLHRARIFGTRTAGAALPSVIETLENGDGFQYAIANYTSEGGRVLEGRGVTPDEIIEPRADELLGGRDPVLEAALSWCKK